jgi:phosphoserine phosphatase
MLLIITRHGETEGNVRRVLAGATDKLTKNGIEQARRLSQRLKEEKIDAIFTSDLQRAKATTEIIAIHHPKTDIIITKDLREMDLGSYTGKGYDEVDWNNTPPDVENRTSMYKRAQKMVISTLKTFPQGTVLFVAHNAFNKSLIRYLRKLHPENKKPILQDNTALTIFDITPYETREILFNCTKHLKDNSK